MKKLLVALLVGAIVLSLIFFDASKALGDAIAWIKGLGPLGPLAFMALFAIGPVIFLPGAAITLSGGAIWGVALGTAYVSIGSTIGATLAFLVARYLARDWVSQKFGSGEKFAAIDEAVGREGFKVVLLTRLSPVFPFVALNYLFGVSRVGLFPYVLASWIGMLPGTVMYVYLGSLAGELAGNATPTGPGAWALRGVGLAATVAVTYYVTKIAREALKSKTGISG